MFTISQKRHRSGRLWRSLFQISTIVGIVVLGALLINILNQTFGYAAVKNKVEPASLAIDGVALERLEKEQLLIILEENVSRGLFRRFEFDRPMVDRTARMSMV